MYFAPDNMPKKTFMHFSICQMVLPLSLSANPPCSNNTNRTPVRADMKYTPEKRQRASPFDRLFVSGGTH